MKKVYLLFIASFIVFSSGAQTCPGCTSTITGNDNNPHVVGFGEMLCISPGANLSGDLLLDGGNVCNQGTISSAHVTIASGALNNIGTIQVDSLLVSGGTLFNSGSCTTVRITVEHQGVFENFRQLTCDYMGFTSGSTTNTGNLHVNQDLYILGDSGISATLDNSGILVIARDFYTNANGVLYTSCMVNVGRDFYNAGYCLLNNTNHPPCAGISIAGNSYNTGSVHGLDICDAGHPAGGWDGNTGDTVLVTYCQCNNVCTATGIDEVSVNDFSLSPNPASSTVQLQLNRGKAAKLSMINMLGETVANYPVVASQFSLDVSRIENGNYLVVIVNEMSQVIGRKKLVIMK